MVNMARGWVAAQGVSARCLQLVGRGRYAQLVVGVAAYHLVLGVGRLRQALTQPLLGVRVGLGACWWRSLLGLGLGFG